MNIPMLGAWWNGPDHTPGSVPGAKSQATVIYLGLPLPALSSNLPEDSAGRVIILCLVLLRTRFTWPPVLPRTPVVSYTTLSALPTTASCGRRSTLCCTFSRVTPGGRYPPFSPAEPGRSSARALACRDAAVSPTHSKSQVYLRRARCVYSDSAMRTRITPVPGQNTTSSAGSAWMSLISAGDSAMLLASDTLPRRRAAPMPVRVRSDS